MKLSEEERGALRRVAALLAAAGRPERLKILRLVSSRSDGVSVGEIQAEVALPASTLSHHLERLRRAGWVTVRRQGPFRWYGLNAEGVRELTRLSEALGQAPGRPHGREKPRVARKTRTKVRTRAAAARVVETAPAVTLQIECD
jgi:ArsR family transcriptional regulator